MRFASGGAAAAASSRNNKKIITAPCHIPTYKETALCARAAEILIPMQLAYNSVACGSKLPCPDFLSFSNPKDGEVCNLKIAGPADTRVCGRFCSWHVILQQGCPLPILLILRHCGVMHGVWMLNSV